MNLEQHIRSEYDASFADDPEPKLSIEIFAAGFKAGMRIGQHISQESLQMAMEKAENQGFDRGNAQGLAYAAYAGSHVSTEGINAAMTPSEAAIAMRDAITLFLEQTRDRALRRLETKAAAKA
jgi:hypothetical protein